MNFLHVFFTLLVLLFTVNSHAKSNETSLQAQLKQHKQLSGQFTQIISGEQSSHTQSSTGEFWIKKPNKFRWHYSTPYVQKIISNGDKLWVYDEDLEQVTIKGAAESIQSSPLAVILGSVSLSELFMIEKVEQNDDLQWLKLIPKEDSSGFDFIQIGFRQGVLSRMLLKDSFGQTTQLLFTNVAVLTPIDDDIFQFQAPQGADVFDETVEQ